jgi:hypothetical protein
VTVRVRFGDLRAPRRRPRHRRDRHRFGWESVGYASVALDARRSVPDAFRELAEREL